jgi:hypothetical protein
LVYKYRYILLNSGHLVFPAGVTVQYITAAACRIMRKLHATLDKMG